MIRLFCQPCAAVSERWVTVHPIAEGCCEACRHCGDLYGVREAPPDGSYGAAGVPWRCPCCVGRGTIETGLRRRMHDYWLTRTAPCWACGGSGLVWAERSTVRGEER